ncbi:MAG: hypothetical protein V1678_02115 [Candidatus Aenigmatarchaeota archaeon]
MINVYKFLSVVLFPPAIALYVTIIFSLFSPVGLGSLDAYSSIAIGSIFLFLIPTASIIAFNKGDIHISKKEDRTIPYLISMAAYVIGSVIFWLSNSHVMFLIASSYFFVSSAAFLINIFWKISAHSAGVAGPTTALVYVFGQIMIPLYVLTFLVSLDRIKLKAHSNLQIAAGAIMSIFITYLVYTILW